MDSLTAESFLDTLRTFESEKEKNKIGRYFKGDDDDNRVIGVRMKNTFDLAKKFKKMPLEEIETLLDSPWYEARMGAVSIMDFAVRLKSLSDDKRKSFFDLYLNRHERINNWDLVDRAAPRVIGGYLLNKPRGILYKLALSDDPWQRRTAIVSTLTFIRNGDVDETFALAEILCRDKEEYLQKAVGACLCEAGKKDEKQLLDFLETHATRMPRQMLTRAMGKLDKSQKAYFRTK